MKREDVLEGAPPALRICGTRRSAKRGTGVSTPAVLALEDGTVFRGVSVGAKGNTTGEVVFNTAMTGYQEILTDPSYCRQIVTLTYPHIGNTGTTPEDLESGAVYAAGLVIRDLPLLHSNWRATESLQSFLLRCKVVAIADIDTRKLTRLLREKGAQAGCIMTGDTIDENAAVRAAKKFPGLEGHGSRQGGLDQEDLPVERRACMWKSTAKPPRPQSRLHVVAYDFGIKRNILRILAEHGCRMTVVPAQTPADQVLAMNPDGIFLSNGPGDPEPCDYAIAAIARFLDDRYPGVRHLPRPSAARARERREDREDEVRPPRRQSPGVGARLGPGADLEPESRFRGGRGDVAGQPARHASLAVRRLAAGRGAHRPAGLQLPGTSRGEPRPARSAPLVRALHVLDGEAHAGQFARPQRRETEIGGRAEVPKRTDLESILIIGAGPIIIGQACEFDYSGAQACKALKEEGYRVVLVNSNPATIMTDPETRRLRSTSSPSTGAPSSASSRRSARARLLPTMGGQTALNTALDLVREGVLEKFNVEMIGASQRAIDMAEDRELFRRAMADIGLETARARIAHSMEEALAVQSEIGFPTVIRPSFTLGGSGGGIAYNREEFEAIVARGLDASPTNEVLLEESVLGWKEYEMEVVRDRNDNCIIVCSIENLDPMGVHTGDSITVAPAQTLTDREYQRLRDASIAVLRKIGVDTGGSNVQFAINPEDGRVLVIEMNPRVSRSSALASKATGFPIAKIAAKLAVGYTLDELKNEITGGATPASFEPTIDYVVTKIPRFTFEKFPGANTRLTTQMKSVGEAMAIGRTFQESMQKALRSLETGYDGFDEQLTLPLTDEAAEKLVLRAALAGTEPHPVRRRRVSRRLDARSRCSRPPRSIPGSWRRSRTCCARRRCSPRKASTASSSPRLRALKRKGFSDARIAQLVARDERDGAQPAPQARAAPGVQARRYLRRGVRDLDRLPVFDLRRGVRGESEQRGARS